jgi:hypothetical protein
MQEVQFPEALKLLAWQTHVLVAGSQTWLLPEQTQRLLLAFGEEPLVQFTH